MASAETRAALNEAINSLRRVANMLDDEALAAGESAAAVPASLINMTPETRAARPAEVQAAAAGEGVHAPSALAGDDSKTAAADAVKAASDDSKKK